MKKKNRRNFDIFNLSFLDVISCGFGAIVLLLLVSKTNLDQDNLSEITTTIRSFINEQEKVDQLEKREEKLYLQIATLNNLEQELKSQIAEANQVFHGENEKNIVLNKSKTELFNKEKFMKTVLQKTGTHDKRDDEVGGIPVDSEYIVFVIDTSGSMQTIWGKVVSQVEKIIKIHPKVKGFKIINDIGTPLGATDNYVRDTETYRRGTIAQLRLWDDYSSSNPVDGIKAALKKIKSGQKTSIYVFGDDFSMYGYNRGRVEEAVKEITLLNTRLGGQKKARIHAVGFIVRENNESLAFHYSQLMKPLTEENGGTFLALPY